MPGAIIAVVVVVAYVLWWKLMAKYRPQYVREMSEGRRCTWCHKPIDDEPSAAHGFGRAHLKCEQQAVRRHVGYYRFFLAMAVLASISTAVCLVSTFLRGARPDMSDWSILMAPIGAFGLALAIRQSVVPWARQVQSSAVAAKDADE